MTTFSRIIQKELRALNIWHFVWISVVISEVLTSIMSVVLRGKITYDYLITGGAVSLIVSSIVVYLINQLRKTEREAEETIREKDEQYRLLVELSPDAISITDLEGKIVMVNQQKVRMTGYSEKELIGMNALDLIAPKDRDRAMKSIEETMEKGSVKNIQYDLMKKGGNTYPVELNASLIKDANDNPSAFIGIVRDISERKRTEEALYESQQLLQLIYDTIPDAIIMVDMDNKIRLSNKSVERILGYTQDELIGSNYSLLVSEEMLKDPQREKRLIELFEKGYLRSEEFYFKRKSGEKFPARFSVALSKDEEGKPIGMVGIFHEITERKQAEEKLKNYANRITAINKASHTLASSLDLQTVVDRCTQIAKQMFAADDVAIFIIDEDREYLTPIANIGIYKEKVLALRLKLGEGLTGRVAQSGEARIVNRIDLTEIGKRVPGTPVEPESLMSVPLKIKDEVIGAMTLSKLGDQEFEEEDLSFIENLAVINAVAIQNARLYKDVKQSEKLKTLFLANMSHEIRTPLNSIIGYTELVENSVGDKVGSEERQFFDIIRNSNERLLRTIHSVLDMSQLEAMSFELRTESIDLNELAEMMVAEHARRAEEKDLDLIYRSYVKRPTIKADKYCISQALSNLLDNAIKYTKKGRITVSLSEKDRRIILQVKDTGIGMTKKYQENLFVIFSQESAGYTKDYQGVGLGLALTKRYLDLNEIPITVTSKKNVGTTFTLTFPAIKKPKVVSKKEKAETPPVEPPDIGAVQRCILVVDDDVNAQRLYKYFLRESYLTCFAVSVVEAKQQLKVNEVDVILLDLSLIGNEDGLDLARYLRTTKRWKELPIIAVTAHAFTVDRDNCLAAGCNDYMSKPIKKPDLLEKIIQYVRQYV